MTRDSQGLNDRFHKREDREKTHRKKLPTDEEPELPKPVEPIQTGEKPQRNDLCSCGSGKKYKKCCGKN